MTRLLPRPPAPVRALGGLLLATGLLGAPQPGGAQEALNPSWSPDGRWIAYQRTDGENVHLWVVGADGLPLQATRGPGVRSDPTWSPDGDRLAFAARLPGEDPDLWILELESGETTRVTRSAERESQPAWSPDGQRLAYVAFDEGGGSELWTVGLDGRDPLRLTGTPDARELHPTWSPDGGSLLYDTGDHRRRRVVELRPATGELRALTDPEEEGSAATPVRDPVRGGVLLTLYTTPGDGDLWRLLPDGTRTRLTDLPGDQGSPAPSPDGRNVAFHSDHEGSYGIYLLRLEEGVVVPVAGQSAP